LENRFDEGVSTEWMNKESIKLMTSFGKEIYPGIDTTHRANKIHDPVLYQYYLEGNWDLY
jgi:spermidine synthase